MNYDVDGEIFTWEDAFFALPLILAFLSTVSIVIVVVLLIVL